MLSRATTGSTCDVQRGLFGVRDGHQEIHVPLIECDMTATSSAAASSRAATATIATIATTTTIAAMGVSCRVAPSRARGAIAAMTSTRAVAATTAACVDHEVGEVVKGEDITGGDRLGVLRALGAVFE